MLGTRSAFISRTVITIVSPLPRNRSLSIKSGLLRLRRFGGRLVNLSSWHSLSLRFSRGSPVRVDCCRPGLRPPGSATCACFSLRSTAMKVSLMNPHQALSHRRGNASSWPHFRHCPTPAELIQLVGNAPFPICPAYDAQASKAVIHCLSRDTRHRAYFGAAAGRPKGRGISSFIRGSRSSEPRITAWT
jgi:hypothetical protein